MATAMSSPATSAVPGARFNLHHQIPWRALTMVIALIAIWTIFAAGTSCLVGSAPFGCSRGNRIG